MMTKHVLRIILIAILGMGTVAPSTSAQSSGKGKGGEGETVVIDLERLKFDRGELDIDTMASEMEDFRQKAVRRILEIDEIVEPALTNQAVELFRISADEYRFLRLQATAPESSQSFKKAIDGIGAEAEYDEILQILDYYDAAFTALRNGQFWIGREESLIPKDQQLYQAMQKEIEKALSATEKGREILALIAEREELKEQLSQPQPILEYLIERRRWWTSFPEYEKALEKTRREDILQLLDP